MQKLGHQTICFDLKLKQTNLEDVVYSDICFVCVPTPKNENGSCNTNIVRNIVGDLYCANYNGIVVIKSTVTPGTTYNLIEALKDMKICHSAEFLRERQACGDFVENQKLLVVGTYSKEIYDKVCEAHGHYPQKTAMLTPTESEILKYLHNSINALRVSFAGEFYDICEKLGANYTKVKNALLHSTSLPDIYLDVNKNMRSWSSICWNKDLPAIVKLSKDLGLDLPLLHNIETSNARHEKTPFAGTRESY